MKFFSKVFTLLLALLIAGQMNGQSQITVGTIINGVPTLTMTDAQLTDTLDFVLNGAILSNSTMQTATDSLGQFYYIKAIGTRPNQTNLSQIAIILEQSGNNLVFLTTAGGCTMECTTIQPCSACKQNIIVRCKSQECTCTSGGGGCDSKITFTE